MGPDSFLWKYENSQLVLLINPRGGLDKFCLLRTIYRLILLTDIINRQISGHDLILWPRLQPVRFQIGYHKNWHWPDIHGSDNLFYLRYLAHSMSMNFYLKASIIQYIDRINISIYIIWCFFPLHKFKKLVPISL